MPRSRRYRKSQNRAKPEWGKNNPEAKVKKRKAIIIVGIIAVAAVLIAVFLVVNQNALFPHPSSSPSPSPSPTASPSSTPTASPSPTPTLGPIPSATPLTSPAGEYSANGTRVLLETSMGYIIIQLRNDKPITTQNFINLVNQGFYDDTVFHRVIAGFMIQGGQNQTVSVPSISDEIGSDNHNYNGTIAMAKTSQPNSAISQFFINVANNNSTSFDSTYTVFGQVIGGMDMVMKISQVQVTVNPQTGEQSQPASPVTLVHAEVLP
jgi:peptidyl-prolyl cis-trans isomerase A (cyclophilin A)